eukprot:TRINITY_DN27739_c0_g1_i3.p1 TRINITY_DN27739_c0_g1~~TRINITY_DN27739_c0_g1_i3.p1  ORF type:complete len:234 (+),score=54.59 TRINITY_DN27739_c0_g1_i3:92-703(+)
MGERISPSRPCQRPASPLPHRAPPAALRAPSPSWAERSEESALLVELLSAVSRLSGRLTAVEENQRCLQQTTEALALAAAARTPPPAPRLHQQQRSPRRSTAPSPRGASPRAASPPRSPRRVSPDETLTPGGALGKQLAPPRPGAAPPAAATADGGLLPPQRTCGSPPLAPPPPPDRSAVCQGMWALGADLRDIIEHRVGIRQ